MAHQAHPIRAVLVLIAVAVLMLSAVPVDAAGSDKTLSIRQTFNVTGEEPKGLDKTGTYTLTAIDGAPMPGGVSGGSLKITLKGDQDKVFSLRTGSASADSNSIVFTTAGVYKYTVKSTTTAKNKRYQLDQNNYTVQIYVKNTGNGGLIIERVSCVDSHDKKSGEIVYHHTYKGEAPTPSHQPKTGDTISIIIWTAVCCAAFAMLIAVLLRRRESEKNQA